MSVDNDLMEKKLIKLGKESAMLPPNTINASFMVPCIHNFLCFFPCCWGPKPLNAPPIFDHNTPINAIVDTSQLLSIDVCAQLI